VPTRIDGSARAGRPSTPPQGAAGPQVSPGQDPLILARRCSTFWNEKLDFSGAIEGIAPGCRWGGGRAFVGRQHRDGGAPLCFRVAYVYLN